MKSIENAPLPAPFAHFPLGSAVIIGAPKHLPKSAELISDLERCQ
jgi:hypothetical protein